MKVNFFVEDMWFFKYIGCATVAKTLYQELLKSGEMEVTWKRENNHADIVHYHTFGPLAAMNRRRTRGVKLLTAHSTPRINMGNVTFAKAINKRYPKIFRRFDHIITISPSCHEEVTRMVPEMPATLIPNGVNRDFFRKDPKKGEMFRERFGIDEDTQVVLTVAQLTPRKGLYDFISLSKKFPEKTFVWVGGFPYGAFSKNWMKIKAIKRHSRKNVIFPGYVDEIIKAYSAADVFFMPSYAETFGLVILEALSCSLPVIARDIPEFRGIFSDNILYFSDHSSAAALLEDGQSLLLRNAAGAREFSAQFDIKDIAMQHLHLYRELNDR